MVVGDNKQTNKHFLPLFFFCSVLFYFFFDDREETLEKEVQRQNFGRKGGGR